ncbi:hypothetical protein PINS_up014537 [Pythium insidiosum]|nr:hypothetical protein PINS_up014537 [Pythium insidiosum]
MRVRFCGGLEPPEWLLADLNLVGKMANDLVAELCESIGADLTSVDKLYERDDMKTVFIARDEAKAAMTVLYFVLTEAAKYNSTAHEMEVELLQLGLTQSMSETVAGAYELHRTSLREQLRDRSLKFPQVEKMKYRCYDPNSNAHDVELRLELDAPALECGASPNSSRSVESSAPSNVLSLTLSEDKFLAMYEELKQAHALLQQCASTR